MVNCSIRKCSNRRVKGGNVSFYTFPNDEKMIKAWLQFCKPKTKPSGRVCSVHFTEADKFTSLRQRLMNEKPKGGVRQLKANAVPSKFLGDEVLKVTEVSCQTQDDGAAKQNRVEIRYSIESMKQDQNITESSSSVTNETGMLTNVLSKSRIKNRIPSRVQAYFVPSGLSSQDEVEASCSTQVSGQSSSTVKEYYVPLTNRTEQIQSQISNSSNNVTITASLFKNLMRTEKKYKLTMNRLRQIFTPGQIRALFPIVSTKEVQDGKLPFGRVQWGAEDIEAAIALRKISPKAYEYMRDVRGFPLPRHTTISRWTRTYGINEDNIKDVLKNAATKMKKQAPKKRLLKVKPKKTNVTKMEIVEDVDSANEVNALNPMEMSEEGVSENVVIEFNPNTEIQEEVGTGNDINTLNPIMTMSEEDISENVVIDLDPSTEILEEVDTGNYINAGISEDVVIEMDPSTVKHEEVVSTNVINVKRSEEGILENVVTVLNPNTGTFEEVDSANIVYVVNPITEMSKEGDTENVVTRLNPITEISEEGVSKNKVKVLEDNPKTEITQNAMTPEMKVEPTKDMPKGVYTNVKVLKVNPKTENPKGVVKNIVRVLSPKTNTSQRSLLKSNILNQKTKKSESLLKNVTALKYQPTKEITMEGVLRDKIMMPPPMHPLKSKAIGKIRKVIKIED